MVEGLSLAELIQQSGRLQLQRAVEIILQAAEGLAAAHRIGVIHRDVKPGNILIAKNGVVKLADFGLAAVVSKELLTQEEGKRTPFGPAGTPAYMAPECLLAPATVDHRADIYSLGATLYHTVTGRVAFEGRSVREVMFKHAQEPYLPPHKLVTGLNPSVSSELLDRMMAKDPKQRFQTYEELIAVLAGLQTGTVLPDEISAIREQRATGGQAGPVPNPASQKSGVHQGTASQFTTTVTPGLVSPSEALQSRTRAGLAGLDPCKLLREGITAANSGDKVLARNLLHKATQINPKIEAAWLWLASVVDVADALHCYESALAVNPTSEHALKGLEACRLKAGIAASQEGDKERARSCFQALIDQNPRNEQAWLWMAGMAESPAEAVTLLERVLEINPNNEHARAGLQRSRAQAATPPPPWECPICQEEDTRRGNVCSACGANLNLLQLDAFWKRPPVEDRHLRQAFARYKTELADDPDFQAHYNMGLVYLNARRHADALRYFQACLVLRPQELALRAQVEAFKSRGLPKEGPVPVTPAAVGQGEQPCVLVVDDSPTIRKLVSLTLGKFGYVVLEAADGQRGLELAKEREPDLILLDINMPGMDGYQVCKAVKADQTTSKIPVIMLSGKDGFFDKVWGKMAGSTRYITKPFQPDVLVQVVDKYCKKQ
jgi:CheY-like chemotaxis protein